MFNSSLTADLENLITKKYYNIGIAVDTNQGLVVPVVKHTEQKTLFQIAEELTILSQNAREGKLTANDMQGGCFTISSLGGIGGVGFTPIINAPEVGILGVSRAQLKPIYINKELQARLMLPLTLSYDHRVIDGAQAAKFSKFIVEQLTNIEFIKDKTHEYSN
jgi:pyruvate dehydrogenase E2 component (dihydrolipoamide acetyltransferase)